MDHTGINKKYKIIVEDGTVDWIKFTNDNNPVVKTYMKNKESIALYMT